MSQKPPPSQLSAFWSTLAIFIVAGFLFVVSFNQIVKDPWIYFLLGLVFSLCVFFIPNFYSDVDLSKTTFFKICKVNAVVIFMTLTIFVLTTQPFLKEYVDEKILSMIRFVVVSVYFASSLVVSRSVKKVDDEIGEDEVFLG